MNCREFRVRIHEFLDSDLEPRNFAAFNEHLETCGECRLLHSQHRRVQAALSMERLPRLRQEYLWKRMKQRLQGPRRAPSPSLTETLSCLWRDRDSRLLRCRLAALPVTMALFLAIAAQFGSIRSYLMLATLSPSTRPGLTEVEVRYSSAEIGHLMDAVWKLPFEDSLSLVAPINPQGFAEIGDILEHPKSPELLEAVDVTLRGRRFEMLTAENLERPFLIYSFQKVDVYEF